MNETEERLFDIVCMCFTCYKHSEETFLMNVKNIIQCMNDERLIIIIIILL